MSKFKYEEKRNGQIYVHEIESYWCKEKQAPRQRRTYLGRKDPVTRNFIPKKKKKSTAPIGSKRIGGVYFLKELSKEIGLQKNLSIAFPDDWEQVLYLSFFKILKKEPSYLYPLWCEENYIPERNILSSQDVSELLSDFGRNEKNVDIFFKNWIQENKTSGVVMFDITSISSYGEGNEFLERGYNRDGENLGQVNLGILSKRLEGKKVHLPLIYRLYPGSITDVVTLNNISDLAKSYDLKVNCFVMDKGFYSQENLKGMSLKGLKHIVPMSFSTKASKDIVEELHEKILSSKSSFPFNGGLYFHCSKSLKIGEAQYKAHIYLDKMRRSKQELIFMKKLFEFEEKFSLKKFKDEKKAKEYAEETIKTKKKFVIISEKGGLFFIKKNHEAIEKEIMKMGVVILLTNILDATKEEVLSLYRSKDSIEKVFNSLKHDINEKRNRSHTLRTMRGRIFIGFISLILISWIDYIMKEKMLYKKMTKIELYKNLDLLRFYELATDELVLGEMTKKQKEIYTAFGVSKKISPNHIF